MATREEYIAVAAELGKIAQEYLDRFPIVKHHLDMEEIGKIINNTAVKAVDTLDDFRAKQAAEKARAKP